MCLTVVVIVPAWWVQSFTVNQNANVNQIANININVNVNLNVIDSDDACDCVVRAILKVNKNMHKNININIVL